MTAASKKQELETDVLIVGAGPAGLSMAIELGMQGHRCLLVERHDRVGLAPRAKTTNVRSRELMRRWGIADQLAAASPFGIDYPSNVVFATRLTGRELARFPNAFYCSPVRDDRFSEHAQWIPQYKVEEVLRAHAHELPGVDIRFSTCLIDFSASAEGITATVSNLHNGDTQVVRAKYLVGADGARSTVREKLGVKMEGTSPLSHHANVIFHAPGLAQLHKLGPAVMYWLVNPDVPSVIAPLDDNDLWTFGYTKQEGDDSDPGPLIRAALGLDIKVDIRSRDEWTAHQLIATRYRQGPVFLIGDACHLHPPFGGHGMNMGIGDAVDLGWKLSAMLSGWGGPCLLDSYETERRQVHSRVVQESVTNHKRNSGSLWREGLEDDGPRGELIRADVACVIATGKRQEFDSLGVVLGSRYDSSPILMPEAGIERDPADSTHYVACAHPGCLAPHAWLSEGRAHGASLFDHFSPTGLTLLLICSSAKQAAAVVAAKACELKIPLKLVDASAHGLHALYGADMALIRPDQFVAWRGDSISTACTALEVAAGRHAHALV